jgi:hypothetical protein
MNEILQVVKDLVLTLFVLIAFVWNLIVELIMYPFYAIATIMDYSVAIKKQRRLSVQEFFGKWIIIVARKKRK